MTVTARPWLDRIEPYRPGRHAATSVGSMASNESPLGVSQQVLDAISGAAVRAHRYPDPLADELREELAQHHGVRPDQILVGNGSDELIFLLACAYLAQNGHAVCADPAYLIDEISTYVVGATLTKVPLRDWAHDLDAMATIPADVAYVVNPHNPTGTVRTRSEIESFVDTSPAGLIVVDEAYIDFVDDPGAMTAVPMVETGRVAVLRTFSKVYGLAGLRIGYLIADSSVITTLRKIRAPFSVSSLAQAAALAAARDRAHWLLVRAHVRVGRDEVERLFRNAGYAVVPSQANFVLVEAPGEQELVERLADAGISVRPGAALGAPGTVRVSIPAEPGLGLLSQALHTNTGRLPASVRGGH
jgi:histidinol-phosphate aminotransferase